MKIAVEHVLLPATDRFGKFAIGNFGLLDRGMQKMAEGGGLDAKNVENIVDLQRIYQQAQAFDRLQAIVLTASGEVEMMSAASANLLKFYFEEEWIDANYLPNPLASWVKQQFRLRQLGIVATSQPFQLAKTVGGASVQQNRQIEVELLCNFETEQHVLIFADRARNFVAVQRFQSIGLSKREAEVLTLVAAGKTNSQISQQLSIGIKTVKKHLEHVFGKLDANSRNDAVEKALAKIEQSSFYVRTS
jgi:DNA-binding CsgD family transcriptional regulator